MSDWTKDPIAVRLLTGKDEPETTYTFTAEAWYEQRKAWMAQGAFITEERIIKLLEEQKANQCRIAHCRPIEDGHDYDCLSEEIDGYIALIKEKK